MRVFVTGASGWVGSAVVQELVKHGHTVVGLARSGKSAEVVKRLGAQVLRGDLQDLDTLRKGAAESDGVVHCGFITDPSDFFANFKENCETDKQVIRALGEVLEGSDRPLIVTSGTALVAPGRLALETDRRPSDGSGFPRVSEQTVDEFTKRGVKSMAIRLSPSVHGENDHGFVPILVGIAKKAGFSAYVGEGKNRWCGVHRLDSATLYRAALEKGEAGAIYHGVGESEIAFKDIAEAIGKGLGLPVKSISAEEAPSHFGWFAAFTQVDAAASSELTVKELGWKPVQPGLIEDILNAGYCK